MPQFICQICNKTFIYKSLYLKHQNRKTPCIKSKSPVNINTITIKTPVSSPKTKSKSNINVLRFMDLFCGIGGFHIAFDKLNIPTQCVMACDIDKSCGEVYQENFNIDIEVCMYSPILILPPPSPHVPRSFRRFFQRRPAS